VLKGRLGLDTSRVPHVDRHGLVWLERGELNVIDGCLHFASGKYVDQIPPVFEKRILSLRAFDDTGMMVDAALAQPGEADGVIRRLFDNQAVDHIDAHNATRGCFSARIERSTATA